MYYVLAWNTVVKEGLPGKSGDASTWEEVCCIGNASKKADTIGPTLYFFSEENDKWKLSVSRVGVAVCVWWWFLLG